MSMQELKSKRLEAFIALSYNKQYEMIATFFDGLHVDDTLLGDVQTMFRKIEKPSISFLKYTYQMILHVLQKVNIIKYTVIRTKASDISRSNKQQEEKESGEADKILLGIE